jgi:nitroreductase
VIGTDALDAIARRTSTRDYKPTPIPRATVEKLLEAARLSPSANNVQPWHFIVVTDAEKRKALSKGIYAKFLKNTPAVIALCGDQQASPKWYVVDVALAGENMVIAATAEGLGTCWIGSFEEKDVKELLAVPENFRVVALLAVGYAKEREGVTTKIMHLVRRRKALSEICSWERFGNKANGKARAPDSAAS